jgi:pimeloyl-ACP methyl ester carboxylesterase
MKLFTRSNKLFTSSNKQHIKKAITLCAMTIVAAFSFNHGVLAQTSTPQDKMITIADHKLHSMSLGEGEFTVIFEAGFGNDLSHWRRVAPAISQQAKVVVYSRAGYGKSSPVSSARTLTQTTDELTAFIKAAQLRPPFIFVGHSYGGHIIRTYAAQHPSTVAGLVFVDPANEAFLVGLKALDEAKTTAFLAVYKKMVPQRLQAENKVLMALDEKGKLPDFGPLPDVPAAVITSMVQEHPQFIIHSKEGKKLWRQLHSNLFSQFSTASHFTTMDSGHNIALQQPTLVIDAINKVIKQASKISQNNRMTQALNTAITLIEQADTAKAQSVIFAALDKESLGQDKVNTLGYQYLSTRNKANQNNALAAIILQYNVEQSPESANAFDSYGESLLALNKPEQAKIQFLKAIELIEKKGNNARALKGFKANLAKAQRLIKNESL